MLDALGAYLNRAYVGVNQTCIGIRNTLSFSWQRMNYSTAADIADTVKVGVRELWPDRLQFSPLSRDAIGGVASATVITLLAAKMLGTPERHAKHLHRVLQQQNKNPKLDQGLRERNERVIDGLENNFSQLKRV